VTHCIHCAVRVEYVVQVKYISSQCHPPSTVCSPNAQFLPSAAHYQHSTSHPPPWLLHFPTLSLAPSLSSLGRAGMGWECCCTACHRTQPSSPSTSVVSLRRVNFGPDCPKVTRFCKVRCRTDVRKLVLAFGVTRRIWNVLTVRTETSRLLVYCELQRTEGECVGEKWSYER
jgi:hypothetical protein